MFTDVDQNALVTRAQHGDRQAKHDLVELFRAPLHAHVRRYLRSRLPEEVEDCVQDILLKVVAHLSDFDPERGVKFSTWVYTFARNHCLDQLKRKRQPTVLLSSRDEEGSLLEWVGAEDPPDAEVLRDEFCVALRRALENLPAELSRIFALREVQGLEFWMIARRLRLPLGTVKSKHYRALEKLQFALRPFRLAY